MNWEEFGRRICTRFNVLAWYSPRLS